MEQRVASNDYVIVVEFLSPHKLNNHSTQGARISLLFRVTN